MQYKLAKLKATEVEKLPTSAMRNGETIDIREAYETIKEASQGFSVSDDDIHQADNMLYQALEVTGFFEQEKPAINTNEGNNKNILDKKVVGSLYKGDTWRTFAEGSVRNSIFPNYNAPLKYKYEPVAIFDSQYKQFGKSNIDEFLEFFPDNKKGEYSIEISDDGRKFKTVIPTGVMEYMYELIKNGEIGKDINRNNDNPAPAVDPTPAPSDDKAKKLKLARAKAAAAAQRIRILKLKS